MFMTYVLNKAKVKKKSMARRSEEATAGLPRRWRRRALTPLDLQIKKNGLRAGRLQNFAAQ
jgi:hypothetical protein